MPIRINLLAEEQAAEEMRRRDPIKRAIFAGVALVLLMIVWIGLTQMNVSAARQELADYEARLQKVDDSSKQVRSNQMLVAEIDSKVTALERYATNRFFWGTFLDALQRAAVQDVRLMEIRVDQQYTGGDPSEFFSTNITVKYTPPPSWWKFWASADGGPSLLTLASNQFGTFTNGLPFSTNVLPYIAKVSIIATNAAQEQATATAKFSSKQWAKEKVVVEVRGRDYGNPPGAAIDEFARRINGADYLKNLLEPESGLRFTERPPQPRPDPQDPVNPNALFVPFTIVLTLEERILTNE